jgi:hypothetical protein
MKKILSAAFLLLTTFIAYSQCACCAGAGIGSSNGDFNNGIVTLPKGVITAEAFSDFRSIKKGSAPEDDEKLLTKMWINSVAFRYGLTKNFTLSTVLPYVSLYTRNGADAGLGDMILLGTYKVYEHASTSAALQGGIELPTGIQKSSNFDSSTVIVGSGSYDPLLGAVLSSQWGKYNLNANLLYKHTTPGFQKNYYGSLFMQSLSLSYKIKGESAICRATTEIDSTQSNFGLMAFAGYSGEWLDKLKEGGMVDDNSGHYLGLANVGVNLSYKKWAFPIVFSLPIICQMNGLQNSFGYRFKVGVSRVFN